MSDDDNTLPGKNSLRFIVSCEKEETIVYVKLVHVSLQEPC